MLSPHPKTRASRPPTRAFPHGFTLVEMLVSMAITLIMMAAVVNLFANMGNGVRIRTATMELSAQLRTVRQRLSDDLAGATCPPTTWQRQDAAAGYIEIVEGQYSDAFPSALVDGNPANGELDYTTSLIPGSQLPPLPANPNDVTDATGLGDYDDILALTVRSNDAPFLGQGLVFNNSTSLWVEQTTESNLAEVVWYSVENPADGSLGEPGLRTVYRRVLLIAPWIAPIDLSLYTVSPTSASEFYRHFDISARFDASSGRWIPNTLADLSKRENRFGHLNVYPHEFLQAAIIPNTASPAFPAAPFSPSPLHPFGLPFEWEPSDPDPANPTVPPTIDRKGEDVMLSDVLAFDVRVYDPGAPLLSASGGVVEPSDAGWVTAAPAVVGFGAYVDLYWNSIGKTWTTSANDPSILFADVPHQKSKLDFSGSVVPSVTYGTWSFHYENDGIDQDAGLDNGAGIDQGTNGLDDSVPQAIPPSPEARNGTDDIGERETSPPYDVPLQGIQIKIRSYDRDSRQIREATVTREFVPN